MRGEEKREGQGRLAIPVLVCFRRRWLSGLNFGCLRFIRNHTFVDSLFPETEQTDKQTDFRNPKTALD